MTEWFREFFDELHAQVFCGHFDEARTRQHVEIVKKRLGLSPGQRVLDVPCGTGRMTVVLARDGFEATGVDLIESYIQRAERLAAKEGVQARFLACDMRRLPFEQEFDAVLNWGDSFGYFPEEENLEFCRRAFAALRPGGGLLVEAANLPWLVHHIRPQVERVLGGARIYQTNDYDPETRQLESTWRYVRGDETETRRLSMRFYEPAEIQALLAEAGFCQVVLSGIYPDTDELSEDSARLVAVGRRPIE